MTISAAARRAGVHPETLRRWEAEGLISPPRTPGGQRRYVPSEVDALILDSRRSQAASA